MLDNTSIEKIKKLLSSPRKCLIVVHKSPDGDAVGSSTALYGYLKTLGHNCNILLPDTHPEYLHWIPNQDHCYIFDQNPRLYSSLVLESEVIFTLDFNDLSRTGTALEELLKQQVGKKTFVMIDHHQQPSNYADIIYSDSSMCSTCQMVYHFIEALDGLSSIDDKIATSIYTGIMTDTGSFRYRNTSATTHRVIAQLIDKGVDNTRIHEQISDCNSLSRLKLKGIALDNLNVLEELNTAIISLSQKELDDCNFQKGDTDGFVNIGLSIKGIELAIICIEDRDKGIIKMSFRSKGKFSVNDFARKYFEGGGHTNAAGGVSNSSLQQTISTLNHILPNYQNALCNNI